MGQGLQHVDLVLKRFITHVADLLPLSGKHLSCHLLTGVLVLYQVHSCEASLAQALERLIELVESFVGDLTLEFVVE